MSTTNSPVRKPLAVKYPFVTESGQDYRDLESLLNDLGAQSGGYYLLGANNFWHGGIHITDEKFIQHKKDHPVRCMMDGTVIAYRLNKQYPTQKWLPNSQLPAKDLQFSNGFCLVKHEYESPVNQQEGENNGKTNTLTFYSLYMHLADYSTYIAETESSVKTITITKDTNARNTEDIASVIGKLKQGSIVQIDVQQSPQQATVSGRRHQFYRATVQTPAVGSDPAVTAGLQVYLYSGCFPAGTFTAAEKPKLPGYWKATVTGKSKEPMRIYDSQAHCMQRNVPPVTKLNPEQPCTFQTEKIIKNVTIEGKVHSIAECQFPASATFRGDKVTSGWMIVDDSQVAWEKVEPTEFDSIVKLAEPLPIAAGDPIGFMGIWESPEPPFITGTTKIRYQMHVELFAADDKTKLEAFLSNSAGLTTGKKYLKVPKGSKLYSSDEHGNFVNPDPLLNAARDYVFEESACTQVKDTAGTVFYNLKGIKTGEAATGPVDFAHVKIEGNVKLITQHDWKELGFTIIEETNDDSDGYLNPEKITSPLFQDIFNRVDGINSQNGQGDGVLTGSEIKNALQQDKDLRSDLYKIIAGHPSEWHKTTQNNMKAHADELSVGNTEEYNNANQFETERFLQCEYVSQIDGLTQKLWHFHPILVVKNNHSCFCDRDFTVDDIKKIISSLRASENVVDLSLFNSSNCNMPETEKTYEIFTRQVNKVFSKYDINSCIRKIHFLAQAYHETGRFSTARESDNASGTYLSGKDYYPYYGRGLLQITWKNTYQHYYEFSGKNVVEDYSLVDSNIDIAFDISGWYWSQGKILRNNNPGSWSPPQGLSGMVGNAVKSENALVPKTIVKYGDNPQEYGVLDLNLLADLDCTDTISWIVNGGGFGFIERRDYVKKIKEIMNYETCINCK